MKTIFFICICLFSGNLFATNKIDEKVKKLYTPKLVDNFISTLSSKSNLDRKWLYHVLVEQSGCINIKSKPDSSKSTSWAEMEKNILSKESIKRGVEFLRWHFRLEEDIAERFGKHGRTEDMLYVAVAIIRAESNFGKNKGSHSVLKVMIQKYFSRTTSARKKVTLEQEILPFLQYAHSNNREVCTIRGSRAGAFGLNQIVPGSLGLMIDADGDNKKDPIGSSYDAIFGTINHLVTRNYRGGWKTSTHRALRNYNNGSARYAEIVILYVAEIKKWRNYL